LPLIALTWRKCYLRKKSYYLVEEEGFAIAWRRGEDVMLGGGGVVAWRNREEEEEEEEVAPTLHK
jgi:hypothetical protein